MRRRSWWARWRRNRVAAELRRLRPHAREGEALIRRLISAAQLESWARQIDRLGLSMHEARAAFLLLAGRFEAYRRWCLPVWERQLAEEAEAYADALRERFGGCS